MAIYFDNAAAARVSVRAAAAAQEIIGEIYGNPSSGHLQGRLAEERMKRAARQTAGLIGVSMDDLVFTSGGTESNALAIFGASKRPGARIITTKAEHPSVLDCFKRLAEKGFEAVFLQPDKNGHIDPAALADSICNNTALVSLTHVNHETGVMTDLKSIGGVIKRKNKNTLFHVDAAQSFGKHEINITECGIDMLSVSAHKAHGIKGAGALYIRKGLAVAPLFYGGGQQRGIRPGTENLPGICALGAAAEEAKERMRGDCAMVKDIKDKLVNALREMPGAEINGDVGGASPYILNVSFLGVPSEVMQNALDSRGIYVSAGAACNTRKKAAVNVPFAYGLGTERANSAIRISLSRYSTLAEADDFINVLREVLDKLRKGY